MSDRTSIEWTHATWNPVRGCTKVSPGCKHCYAETFAERFRDVPGHPFEQGFDLRPVPEALELPLRWKTGRLIFVNSMSDLFHEDIPDAYIEKVFDVIARAPQHQFQVLTKRAERMRAFASTRRVPPNAWMGVSVESAEYRWRIKELRAVKAAVRFKSRTAGLVPARRPRRFIVRVLPLAGALLLAACQHAATAGGGVTDEGLGDQLTRCAAAHTVNVKILLEAQQDVAALYRMVGYFKVAGEAYTSRVHAERTFAAEKEALESRMGAALSAPEGERVSRARRFMDELSGELRECAELQRANKASIDARVRAALGR